MQKFIWSDLSPVERKSALARPESRQSEQVTDFVHTVFSDVAANGDEAVSRWSRELDGCELSVLELDDSILEKARAAVSNEDCQALQTAADNIRTFHEAEPAGSYTVETTPGVNCSRLYRPLHTAGLYVPGGTAPLFSTLLMLALPARVAGVQEVVICTPPSRDQKVNPLVILAAALCEVNRIYLVGGAQAVAAMATGTDIIPKVDIIAGPGNAYVTAAKTYAANMPGGPIIDMPAGPSELLVIADETADPSVVAADLLSQAEHDPMAQVMLVVTNEAMATKVERELSLQVTTLPREKIARASLESARFIIVDDVITGIKLSNQYAPEHLSLNVEGADQLVGQVTTAGTVFVGAWAAETFGDYAAGPSHVLPTDGAARTWSGVSVSTFLRSMTVQSTAREGVDALGSVSARLARLEGLEAHARAADIRLEKLQGSQS